MLAAGIVEKNRFLASLPASAKTVLESRLTTHNGAIGDVLQVADSEIDAVWFPLAGMVSSLRPLERGAMVEVDAAGIEGFLGIELALGATTTADTWMVQAAGRFARLETKYFLEALDREPGLRDRAMRYAWAALAVRGQWVACNARHTIEQRLAKWLLVARDRVGEELQITQDVIATMLGVRRASVVTVLGRFVDDGIVAHGYARLKVVDEERLRGISCVCYQRSAELIARSAP